MKNLAVVFATIIIFISAIAYMGNNSNQKINKADFHDPVYSAMKKSGEIIRAKQMPNSWFMMQRAYPNESFPQEKYLAMREQARKLEKESANIKNAQWRDVAWTQAGPANIPGRITDIAVHPDSAKIVYAASAAGGVFKSTDSGQTWTPIFDDVGPQSIGAIAINPQNPDMLLVGTGEANGSGDSYEGTGIYKSIDGGDNWSYVGLPESYHIGRILIDPLRPDTVYAAVMGKLFGTNPDRGIYRSLDGGENWTQMFYIDDSTGCVDIAMQPSTGHMLAAMWYRWRGSTDRRVGGVQSGIFKSTDFGVNWTRITNGLPAQADTVGRIGLAVEPTTGTAYAIYANHPGYFMGVYKSYNMGTIWTQTNDAALEDLYSSFGWYFGNIRVAYGNPSIVFVLGVPLFKSTDGGNSWNSYDDGIHVDHHALYLDPDNINFVIDGCDGGVNFSSDQGSSWARSYDMANSQFYAITIDHSNPERLYGGTQDNGTMRTLTGATDDWGRILGGDGFYVVVDFTDPNTIYAEYQWGYLYKSTDGGYYFDWALGDIDYGSDRHNWCTPFIMDPTNHNSLCYGSNKLYRTYDGGSNWTAISDDLTNGPGPGNLTFGTLTTIDIARTNNSVIYVGTDDANVWVTEDNGDNWTNISSSLPNRCITRVTVDPYDAATAYVTLSGYKISDHLPHIYRTINYGTSWDAIDGNLPDGPINDVIVDPDFDSTLYIGTDYGVYYTIDLGANWIALSSGLPLLIPIHDLAFHSPTRTLVAGTHGRSMYKTILDCPGEDNDGDEIADLCDNCPDLYNPDQQDNDNDNIGNVCDNCPDTFNTDQQDSDSDNVGDICDNCPDDVNSNQDDLDDDDIGDICDNCPDDFNTNQSDTDTDSIGDICDNCPTDANLDQFDTDEDSVGDVCDNCPDDYNPDQSDSDENGVGDVCDYVCGDPDDNRMINILDITFMIAYLYKGGPAPESTWAADPDGNGMVNILDITYLISYLYKSGPAPICE